MMFFMNNDNERQQQYCYLSCLSILDFSNKVTRFFVDMILSKVRVTTHSNFTPRRRGGAGDMHSPCYGIRVLLVVLEEDEELLCNNNSYLRLLLLAATGTSSRVVVVLVLVVSSRVLLRYYYPICCVCDDCLSWSSFFE